MNATIPTPRRLGDIDTSFGTDGVFAVQFDGYGVVEPGEIDTVRALDRAPDGSYMLALGFRNAAGSLYGLVRLKQDGKLDPTYGGGKGFVLGSLPAEQTMAGAQPWITPDGKTVVVLRDQLSETWTLARHDVDGAQDKHFGVVGDYINLDSIRPPRDPVVVKGFVIAGHESSFYFIGSMREPTARRATRVAPWVSEGVTSTECGNTRLGRYAGAVVFRFDGAGQLDPTFAGGKGYKYVDIPLNPSGRITDAVLQDDGKLVVSTATTGGNARIVRLLGSTGEPDPAFGTNGVFEVKGDSAERTEIEKLAWSAEAGLWGVGRTTNLSHKGLLIALDDKGTIREDFNGGQLLTIDYGATESGKDDGFAIPIHMQISGDGVIVAGGPRRPYGIEPKVLIVGRHRRPGALDPSFGEADETGTRKGFYTVNLDREGFNFFYLGMDLNDEHLTLELLNGDGMVPPPDGDRTTVERFTARETLRGPEVNVTYKARR